MKDEAVYKLVGHNGGVLCCKFLSDKYLISGGSDAAVCVWDLEKSHKYLSMYTEHNSDCVSMNAYKEDRNIFVTGSSDLTAKIWDIRVKDPV
jgi:WD40 repeat protein